MEYLQDNIINVTENTTIFLDDDINEDKNFTNKQLNDDGRLYTITDKIDRCHFGNIYKCITPLGRNIAIKVINKYRLTNRRNHNLLNIQKEIDIHKNLRHSGIINLEKIYQSKDQIFILLEYCKSDLYKYLYNPENHLTESISKAILHDITIALMYLHEKLIVHCDIKLENILIDENNNAKIADFGSSQQLTDPEELLTYIAGTADYLSPEIVLGPRFSLDSDIWALGVLFYELLFKILPFKGDTNRRIIRGNYIISESPLIDETSRELIKGMLTVNREERITLSGIISKLEN